MIFRVSALVLASLAASALFHHAQGKSSRSKNTSTQHKEAREIPEEEEIEGDKWINVKEDSELILPRQKDCGELEHLQNLIMELKKRKANLEVKLRELYGVKEQESYIAHLRRNLEVKIAETHKLGCTIAALRAETRDLQEKTWQGYLAKKKLETATKMIEEMRMKMGVIGSQMKGQILKIEEQLSGYNDNGTSASRNALVDKKLEAVQNVGFDVIKMRRENKELELEKRELAVNLVAAHAKITTLTKETESQIVTKIEKEISMLRNANENLSKEVERLQRNRFDMVEELVYQRWLNACLRFEALELGTTSKKTLRDEFEEINSGEKPLEKIKLLMLDSNTDSSSSNNSSNESDGLDSSTTGSSSSSQQRTRKKSSIKSWRINKDISSVVPLPDKCIRGSPVKKNRLFRRFSTSILPSKPSVPITVPDSASSTPSCKKKAQDSSESRGTSFVGRVRRVSFNDAVETAPSAKQDRAKSDEDHADKGTVICMSDQSSTMKASSYCQSELEREKYGSIDPESCQSSDSSIVFGMDGAEGQVARRKGTAHTEELHSKITNVVNEKKTDAHIVNLIVALFFLFLLFIYFLHL